MRINGVDSALTMTLTGTSQTVTGSVAVAVGDYVSVYLGGTLAMAPSNLQAAVA